MDTRKKAMDKLFLGKLLLRVLLKTAIEMMQPFMNCIGLKMYHFLPFMTS